MYHWMTQAEIQRFLAHLRREERSPGTLAKYRRDLLAFAARLPQGGRVDKEQVLAWKEEMARRYAPSTVNSMIAALNGFFAFQGWHGCRVKALRQQREIFREKARELCYKGRRMVFRHSRTCFLSRYVTDPGMELGDKHGSMCNSCSDWDVCSLLDFERSQRSGRGITEAV